MSAQLIGFGGPVIFAILFLLINYKLLSKTQRVLLPVLLYVLSVAGGIGLSIMMGMGAIGSGFLAPLFFLILFTVQVRKPKMDSDFN
ncbi:MAG: hypothetical protein GYB31_03780 [Bacteroidetes bacterium]|nr:hypothetical protein [Bacteroidota bacterium]